MSVQPAIVDSHCHLDVDAFSEDVDEVVARARAAGVARMVTICMRPTQLEHSLAIAEKYDEIYSSVGIHPHLADDEPPVTSDALVELARHPKIVGIGEAGLDYHYDYGAPESQQTSFRMQIDAARKSGLPLIVHTREADDDTADILEDEYAKGPFTGVLHCFTAGRELAERAVAIGFYVSLSGIITFKSAEDIRNTVRALPADRLLVETDAPFLAPIPKRGKRNEPALVRHTFEALAALKEMDTDTFARQTNENFFRLFSKVAPLETVG
jgi:TatD DNase family protein